MSRPGALNAIWWCKDFGYLWGLKHIGNLVYMEELISQEVIFW